MPPPLAPDVAAFAVERLGRARVELRGASMLPTLRPGMVAEVQRLDSPPRIGEILVFRGADGLVAHRLIARRRGRFITCGDALPERPETVPPHSIVGRIAVIWAGPGPDARRLGGRLSPAVAIFMLGTRHVRVFIRYVAPRLSLFLTSPARAAPAPAFAALVVATRAFEAGDAASGVATLSSIPADVVVSVALRHQLGGLISHWLERAAAAGVNVPGTLREPFTRARFASALQATEVIGKVHDVVGRLNDASIPAIVLKGGARLASGRSDAQLHYSGDIDVLVDPGHIEGAVAVLRAAGYRQHFARDRIAFYTSRHHHHAPLIMPGERVPVELHVALSVPRSVSQVLDFARLLPVSELVDGPAGTVRVLDDLHSALHLAYHGRDLRVWRDIVLLSRMLRAMAPEERARFDAMVDAERRDRVRLKSAVAAADGLCGPAPLPQRAIRQYLVWCAVREDSPDVLRRRAHIVDAVMARSPRHFSGWRESLVQLRGWAYNIALTPVVLAYWYQAERRRVPAIKAFPFDQPARLRPNGATASAARTHTNAIP
ncbi:MAG: nucleotidyltransferase family protein [Candidatus Eremiobacteraeota bacterium]|nr:nucleotidyltransferase family protein [Candidatus Eremiobacteraeota bacterium]MBC5803322.1 nucleotidyltransferase family protein [Candidatus Eremiobacteraeota bacterium]MBC5822844.1 nucleotidyltransferase family protein [Candidatus Eremiobacteraeota bacterium]